jgi:hypothetical protein
MSGVIHRQDVFLHIQNRFRMRRIAVVADEIRRIARGRGRIVRILDAGGRADFWTRLPSDLIGRIHVTILNVPEEDMDRYPAPQGLDHVRVAGDACAMPQYSDGAFDLAHANSVIEHVGCYAAMVRFAAEIRRVGRRYIVQTPNQNFPIEPHYRAVGVHWRGDMWRIRRLNRHGLGYLGAREFARACATIDSSKMIDRWFFKRLFPDATMHDERVLGVFVKSFTAVGDGAMPAN